MNLKNDIGTGFQKSRNMRIGRCDDTEPGSYWAKYPPMVSGLPASLAPRSMAEGAPAKYSPGFLSAIQVIARLANRNYDVMNYRTIAGPDFGGNHPLVFFQIGWNDHPLVGKYLPLAGTLKGTGASTMRSGLPASHPSTHLRGAGASFGLPSGAPASTQATRVSISAWVRDRSLENFP